MTFVDTWAWIALADRRDQFHAIVVDQHQRLVAAGERYATSDFVLNELITYLYDAVPVEQAEAFIGAVIASCDDGSYLLVHVSPDQFRTSWELRRKYGDHPDISFVDFTSMVVMHDLHIREIFTGDAHFLHVGLGFKLVPPIDEG